MFLNGDINKYLLNSNFRKIYLKFVQKFKTVLQSCLEIKFNKISKNLLNFQNFSESVEHLK